MEDTHQHEFSFVGERLCLDFTNTVSSYRADHPNNYVASYADLVSWARQAQLLTADEASGLLRAAEQEPAKAERVLERALSLRAALYGLFSRVAEGSEIEPGTLSTLNAELSEAMRHRRIEQEGEGFAWGWRGIRQHLDGMLWAVAMSAAELLTSDDLTRVRECAGDTCGWLFADMSRNHSRHWCDMRDCGNRAKARRHYHRQKAVSS